MCKMVTYTFQRPRRPKQRAVQIADTPLGDEYDSSYGPPKNYSKGMLYVLLLILLVISGTSFMILTKGLKVR